MPTARAGIAAAVVDNELWVFGGEEQDGLHGEVEVYTPVSNTWRREPNRPLPRHGSWASVIGNKIYIPGGGARAGLAPTNTNQIFTVDEVLDSGAAAVADFNADGHPDWVVRNAGTRQTAIWYLNNNVLVGGALGPTLPVS
jgi:N-acetylneuraminic acid mutarotase